MNKKENLEELFKEFPGVGPRQAKRFVYFLLWKNQNYIQDLTQGIIDIKQGVKKCQQCNRFFDLSESKSNICNICNSDTRKNGKILIIEKNPDFENIEKMNIWDGQYFLIGKNLRLTEENPDDKLNLYPLIKRIKNNEINEIIFALSLTPEGENTREWISEKLLDIQKDYNFDILSLGRGISMGSELEYSDKTTLSSALENRK